MLPYVVRKSFSTSPASAPIKADVCPVTSHVPVHRFSRKRTVESRNGAYHGGTKDFPVLGHRRAKSWCISGMPHMSQRQPRPKQPTAHNSYPTRIEGYARIIRAASGQDITSAQTAVGFSRVTGKRAEERRSQFKNGRQTTAHTWPLVII
jgi:hypothetical protein